MTRRHRDPPQVPARYSRRRIIVHLGAAAALGIAGFVLLVAIDAPGSGDAHHHLAGAGRSVTDLVDRSAGPPDVDVLLIARMARVTVAGRQVDAWTFDGSVPGPTITVRQSQLVQVKVHNVDLSAGVTVHWHGVEVPGAMDGVAGMTQDAIAPGGDFVYRFRPPRAGTFWYHTHQVSSVGVAHGLFGALVVLPGVESDNPSGLPPEPGTAVGGVTVDRVLLAHTWPNPGHLDVATINSRADTTVTHVDAGAPVRLRLINTDSVPQRWAVAGTAFTVTAIDGVDVHRPAPLRGSTLTLGAGGRFDIAFVMPDGSVSVGLLDGNRPRQAFTPNRSVEGPEQPAQWPELVAGPAFDPLDYGLPAPVPFTMDSRYDVDAVQVLQTHRIVRRGVPTTWWTINGRRFPDVPMIMVDVGDAVRVHIVNDSDTVHPMHLHGHHVVVLQRNGIRARGSPWWADTVNLAPGDDVWVAFRADNPGIWMDHCHNLDHAAAGMLLNVGYRGISTPFAVGDGNQPE